MNRKAGSNGKSETSPLKHSDERISEYTERFPVNIIKFNRDRGLHPTQKPVLLLEYLIKTYTNEGETVLDNCMGSGSTGVACLRTNRKFIGIELEQKYYDIAKERIKKRNGNFKVKRRKVLIDIRTKVCYCYYTETNTEGVLL